MDPSRPFSPLHAISTLFSQYSDFPTGQTNRTEIKEEVRSMDVGDRVTVIKHGQSFGRYRVLPGLVCGEKKCGRWSTSLRDVTELEHICIQEMYLMVARCLFSHTYDS